jgi:hypothetical protein
MKGNATIMPYQENRIEVNNAEGLPLAENWIL